MSQEYVEKIPEDRLLRIEGDISMLKDAQSKHAETIYGVSLGFDRINSTIRRVIDVQEEHANRLKEIEAISFLSKHWKFLLFTILTIIVVSLSIHASVKEVVGWLT